MSAGTKTVGRRVFTLCAALFAFAALCAPATLAQGFPRGPVRLIVGFTAGSATDITARIFAQKLSEAWRVPVTVENIAGAGGSIGVDRAAKAAPDGQTLLWAANGAMTIVPSLQERVPYDSMRDFTPISQLLAMPNVLAVHPDSSIKTLQDLITQAKAQPGQLSYSSPGIGTPQHVGGELLKTLAGIDVVHIPYRGAVLTDVLGGRVTVSFQNAGVLLPVLKEGKLRGIAVSSKQRSPLLADLPTIAESGFPGFEAVSWFGLMAPAGLPQTVAAQIYADTMKIMQVPETRAQFTALGLDIVANSPAEFSTVIKTDIEKWAGVITRAGIKAGN